MGNAIAPAHSAFQLGSPPWTAGVFGGETYIRHIHTWLRLARSSNCACSVATKLAGVDGNGKLHQGVRSFYSLPARVRSWPVSSALIFV